MWSVQYSHLLSFFLRHWRHWLVSVALRFYGFYSFYWWIRFNHEELKKGVSYFAFGRLNINKMASTFSLFPNRAKVHIYNIWPESWLEGDISRVTRHSRYTEKKFLCLTIFSFFEKCVENWKIQFLEWKMHNTIFLGYTIYVILK